MSQPDFGIGILGVGRHLPARIVLNDVIERGCGLPLGTIETKTGIRSRHMAAEDDTASAFSEAAARAAMAMANVGAEDIGLIICCTFTGDYVYPALACKVQQLLGAHRAGAFDIMANCTGFQVGLTVAADRLNADPDLGYALVIGTALQSRFIDWTDPNSATSFGDGAGAAVLGRVPAGYGLLASEIHSDPTEFESLRLRGGGSSFPMRPGNVADKLQFYEMDAATVWKQVIQHQPKAIRKALEKAGKVPADVDFFVFHQANLFLIEFLMGKLRQPMTKTLANIKEIGNTADASLAIALSDAVSAGMLKHDDLVVVSGVGAGFTFGATVMKWHGAL